MRSMEEIRELTVAELRDLERELRREIFDLRMQLLTDGGVHKRYREARKELARVLTALRQKQTTGAEA